MARFRVCLAPSTPAMNSSKSLHSIHRRHAGSQADPTSPVSVLLVLHSGLWLPCGRLSAGNHLHVDDICLRWKSSVRPQFSNLWSKGTCEWINPKTYCCTWAVKVMARPMACLTPWVPAMNPGKMFNKLLSWHTRSQADPISPHAELNLLCR